MGLGFAVEGPEVVDFLSKSGRAGGGGVLRQSEEEGWIRLSESLSGDGEETEAPRVRFLSI